MKGGAGEGLFIWVLEDGARRPPSYYDLQGYSLPSPTGRGKPTKGGAGEGLFI